jgi:hypothetical protein
MTTTTTTMTNTTMTLTSIHITLTLSHRTPPSRPRILLPTPACLLACKGHILRLAKTRHRTTSNGVLNRRPSRSTSPSPNPNPI